VSGPLDAIAVAGVRTVLPLSRALGDGWALRTMLREMGWAIDLSAIDDALVAQIPGAAAITSAVGEAIELVGQMEDPDAQAGDIVGAVITLVQQVAPEIERLADFDADALIADATSPLAASEFWAELALDLPEYLLLRYLRDYQPVLRAVLRMLGVIVDEDRQSPLMLDPPPGMAARERLLTSALTSLVDDPDGHVSERYGWQPNSEIDHSSLIADLAELLRTFHFPSRQEPIGPEFGPEADDGFYPTGHPALLSARQLSVPLVQVLSETTGEVAEFGLQVVPVPSTPTADAPVDTLYVTALADSLPEGRIEVDDLWTFEARSGFATPGATGLLCAPGSVTFDDSVAGSDGGLTLAATPDEPWRLLGGDSGPRLLLHGVELDLDIRRGPPVELAIAARTAGDPGLELVVDPGDGDGFVSALLSNVDLSVPFELGLSWSSVDGFVLDAATGLAVDVPLGQRIGPIELNTLHLLFVVGTDGFSFAAGITASAELGPVVCSVANIGMLLELAPPDGGGSLQASLAFKPPEGIGIGVDLGVVSGGGYLDIDVEAGSYDGVIDLEVLGVGVCAVAIIDTKLPDVDGWSMFFALFLDLPSIQLGFGFTLTGVGGVAGINRAIDVDALGSAVRSGSLDTILFPEDPIADAPIIIEEFRSIFPPADGSYVFGPIVKIGWGTPTLIEAELGIVIQLPDPLVIVVLGSVSAVLPHKDLELVALNLDVAGAIDFEAGTLAIDASLHDSHVVGFALSGDMALRAEFGNAQAFLMSVGGFHPRFDPPGDFPDLRPVTFGITAGSVLRIDFMSYFALTSNSVQCGADFTLDADVMGFGVYGSCGFDALIQFSPFMVITSVDFEVSITAAGVDLMGVMLYASVEGPNRWHVIGTARFEVLGFGKDIRVDELIGSKESEPAVEAADVLTELLVALATDDAWRVIEANDSAVTLQEIDDPNAPLMATPDSVIEVRQTLVPLGIDIEQFGNAPVRDHSTFELTAVGLEQSGTLDDWFAPGQFFELGNDDKLEGPEFELMRSGIQFGGGAPIAGEDVGVDTGYKAYIIDPEFPEEETSLGKGVVHELYGVPVTAHTQGGFNVVHTDTVGTKAPTFVVVDDGGTTVTSTTTWSAAYTASAARSDLHIERELAVTS
jgi:hypothetical protein